MAFSLLSSSIFTTNYQLSLNPKNNSKTKIKLKNPNLHKKLILNAALDPIFLPFLHNHDKKELKQEENEKNELNKSKKVYSDPIIEFLKSRVESNEGDPRREGKIKLKRNRKVSWHLAKGDDFGNDELGSENECENMEISKNLEKDVILAKNIGNDELGSENECENVEISKNLEKDVILTKNIGNDELGSENECENEEISKNLTKNAKKNVILAKNIGKEELRSENECENVELSKNLNKNAILAKNMVYEELGSDNDFENVGVGGKDVEISKNLSKNANNTRKNVILASKSECVFGNGFETDFENVLVVGNVTNNLSKKSIFVENSGNLGNEKVEKKIECGFGNELKKNSILAKKNANLGENTGNSGNEELRNGSETDSTKVGVVMEILDIAKNLPENVTLGEKLGDFEGSIGEKECIDVLGLMEEEGLVMGCLWFFEWMSLRDPSLVTSRAYSVLFPLLGRFGKGDVLLVLFNNLPNVTEFRDVRVYNAAISGLLCCGRYEDAWKVYETMEKENIRPDHVTCSIMITIMQRSGRSAKDSWDFFDSMNKKGVDWSVEVLGALIKSFCNEGLKKEALIIQLEMERKGVFSNAIVYNTLMDAFSKDNHIEEAEGLFAEMKRKGINPTSVTYNILMDAYSKRMQPEIIEKLLLEMQNLGLEANVKSYTCLISAYGKHKKMSDMAADAFLRMKKVGIKPSSHSYTALIHAYSLDGWHEKALVTFENMLREGVKPSVETYTALLDAFRRCGDTEMLMNIWKMMIREKIGGTRVTFHTLLDGFAKQGRYVEARDVICEFGKIGLEPTVLTYNMLMNAYARGGQQMKLPQLLKEMSALRLKPDSITYSTMIYAYVRVRDFSRAFYYHKMMVKSAQVPDAKSYEKLRAILDLKAAIKNKKDRKAILGIAKSNMGLLRPKKKGKKDEFWKNKKNKPRIRTTARVEQ